MKKHSIDVVVFLKFFVVFLCLSLFVSLMPSLGVAYDFDASFIGGIGQNGVPKNAVHIQTAAQLANIGGIQSEGKYYVLDNDIDLVKEWVPIDDFRGTFDGQGYSINNLYVLASSHRSFAGLFGGINNATIKNVGVNVSSKGLTAISTYGPASAGGLAGWNYGSNVTVVNCYVTGDMAAISTSKSNSGAYSGAYAGGLIGRSLGEVFVVNCYVTSDVAADAHSTIFAHAYAGGLVGNVVHVSVANSCTTGTITATTSGTGCAGGLVGQSDYSPNEENNVTVKNCYATGAIVATTTFEYAYAGGLVGSSGNSVTVEKSYATGNIKATASSGNNTCAGGLIGWKAGRVIVESCYRLATQKIIGDTVNDAGKPLFLKEMKISQSFVGWDFDTMWSIDPNINGGYPHLTMFSAIGSSPKDNWGLFGFFWFVILLLLLLVGVIAIVVLFFCCSRRRKLSVVVDGGLLNSCGSLEGYV